MRRGILDSLRSMHEGFLLRFGGGLCAHVDSGAPRQRHVNVLVLVAT